jgi:molybdopterin synthase catalytic subunit
MTAPLVALRAVPIAVAEAIEAVSHAGAGGIAVFCGVVRDANEGRAVTRLEYEAYAPMAVAEMQRIASEAVAQAEKAGPAEPGHAVRVAIVHRTGSLGVGDVAVICAASAVHRHEALTACRFLIDQVKARVPIWKREHGPEGAYWVGWEDARCHH